MNKNKHITLCPICGIELDLREMQIIEDHTNSDEAHIKYGEKIEIAMILNKLMPQEGDWN